MMSPKGILFWLVSPATVTLLLLVLAICTFRKRKFAITFISLAILWLSLWSSRAFTIYLSAWLNIDHLTKAPSEVPSADAIVVLGGGVGVPKEDDFYPELYSAADRILYAAQLWKQGKASVIIPTGLGAIETDARLLQLLDVPEQAILIEGKARNTEENARYVAEILRKSAIQMKKVILVTSVWHMKRSLLLFKKCAPEILCVPFPVDYDIASSCNKISVSDFLPNAGILERNTVLLKELLGYFYYKWFL